MENLIIAIQVLLKHLQKQASNYCLLLGVFFVLRFIFIKYGIDTTLLCIGVLLLIIAFVIEANKKNVKKIR